MKTIEEKAGEYAEKLMSTLINNEYDMHPKEALIQGFIDGYTEASRWRDPKEELPEEVGLYLCKCEKKLGFYFDIVFFNKVWRSDSVIGWRPIE